jgi:hypothetical protein
LPGFINKEIKNGTSIMPWSSDRVSWAESVHLVMEVPYRVGGLKGPEIGGLFGIDYGLVSQERKRLREKLANDRKLRALISRIEGILSSNG